MRKHLLLLFFSCSLSFLLFCAQAHAGEQQADHDCAKCHKLGSNDAAGILKDGIPNLKIIEVRQAPVKGFWEIAFESGGQKGIIYLDYSKQKALVIGSGGIFDLKAKVNHTAQRMYEINKVDVSKIPLEEALVMGDKNAPKKVIVFTDPD